MSISTTLHLSTLPSLPHITPPCPLLQANDESDASKPLQIAISVAQEVSKQLPFTVLPAVLSGWVALMHEKERGAGAPGRWGEGGG